MPSANRYTTTEFLASIRRKGHIPPSQTPFQDADLLSLADDELCTAILRQVRTAREGFYKTYVDLAPSVNGYYDIPTRAVGIALDDIQLVTGTQIFPVCRTESNEQFSTITSPTGYYSFELINDQILAKPNPTTGVVRLWHMRRPNKLVPVASASQVTAINQGTGVLTFASLPTSFLISSAFDCIADQPHFRWKFIDFVPTGISSTTLTFANLPTDTYGNALIQVGDWVALAGQSPIPQLPVEFIPLLVQRTIVKYYEIQNYKDKIPVAQKKLEDMEKDVFELINPRVSNQPKRIVPDCGVIGGFRRSRAYRAT